MPSKCSHKRQTFILVSASLAVLVNMVAVFIGAVCLTKDSLQATSQRHIPTEEHVGTIACVTCESGRTDPLLEKLDRRTVNGTQYCCAGTTGQMSVLMELVLSQPSEGPAELSSQRTNFRSSLPSSIATQFNMSKASAHKLLVPPEVFNSSQYRVPQFTNQIVRMKLSESNDGIDHAREVDVSETGISIIHPGLYYVYTNVFFKPDSSQPCRAFTYQTWEQRVMKGSGQRDTTLMKVVHTCADTQTRDKETRFAGGVFDLEEGDHLHVSISGLGLATYRSQYSFLGLAMMSGAGK